jgi:hypothetical protein
LQRLLERRVLARQFVANLVRERFGHVERW